MSETSKSKKATEERYLVGYPGYIPVYGKIKPWNYGRCESMTLKQARRIMKKLPKKNGCIFKLVRVRP